MPRITPLRRLDDRIEELQGGIGEMVGRLGSVWPVPIDCAADAREVHEGLACIEMPLRRLRRGLRRHLDAA